MPNTHDTPQNEQPMDIHDLVPVDDDRQLLEVYDTDLTEGAQERRRQIVAHIQHVTRLVDEVDRGEASDPKQHLADVAGLTAGGGEAWLNDLEALHSTLMYARATRVNLQQVAGQLAELKDSLNKADTDHPLVARIDEVLREYHEMEFDMDLMTDIQNAWNGMTNAAVFGILSALQGEPVGRTNAESVAHWLRHIADRIEVRSQEQAS